MDAVRRLARSVAWRLGVAETVRQCARGLCGALGLAMALVLAERLFAVGLSVAGAVALPAAVAVAAGLALGLARWPSLAAAALLADRRLALDERLSSALAAGDGPMAGLVRADAEAHVAGIEPAACFPVRIPSAGRVLPLLVALVAIALMVPDVDVLGRGEARAKGRALRAARQEAQAAVLALRERAADEASTETTRTLEDVLRALANGESATELRRAADAARSNLEPRPDVAAADQELLRQAHEAIERLQAHLGGERRPSPQAGTSTDGSAGLRLVRPDYVPPPKPSPLLKGLIDARAEADLAMARDNVPWRYRAIVKRYFTPETDIPRPGR